MHPVRAGIVIDVPPSTDRPAAQSPSASAGSDATGSVTLCRRCAVVDRHDRVAAPVDVDLVGHQQVLHAPGAQLLPRGADRQHALQVLPYRLLGGAPSARLEGVVRVLAPSARKVAAVVGIVAAGEGDLVAVVDERRPARGGEEGEGELEPVGRGPRLAHEARDVVEAEEGDEVARVAIQVVAREHLRQLAHRPALGEGIANRDSRAGSRRACRRRRPPRPTASAPPRRRRSSTGRHRTLPQRRAAAGTRA